MKATMWIASVLCLISASASAQTQETTFSDPVLIDSSTPVSVGSITVSRPGNYDVALTAHVYAEVGGADGGRYDIGICAGDASGPHVGRARWRPGDRTPERSPYEADTTTLTGFDANVSGSQTYVLCVSKFDAASPDATVYLRGLNAVTAPAGTTLAGSQVTDFSSNVDILNTTDVSLGSVIVDAGAGSDVLLTAHARLEGAGLGNGYRYEIAVRRGSTSGPVVGHGFWRPPQSANPSQGDSIAVTGVDAGVSGSTTYYLTGSKYDLGAPDVTASLRGLHAVVAPAGTTLFGTRQLSFSPSTALSPSNVALASIVVEGGSTVRLTGEVYLEGSAVAGRYEVGICRDDENGPLVGRAYWRPNSMTSDANFVGDTVVVTGYDAGISGPTTYVLCASVFDGPTVSAYNHALVAQVPEPGLAPGMAAAAAALASLRRVRRGPV